MIYRNNSSVTKTFYGVVFHPGDVKAVPGYINDLYFVPVKSMPKEPPKRVESVQKSESQPLSKKPTVKKESEPKKFIDSKKDEPKESNNKDAEKPQEVKIENGGELDGTDSNK